MNKIPTNRQTLQNLDDKWFAKDGNLRLPAEVKVPAPTSSRTEGESVLSFPLKGETVYEQLGMTCGVREGEWITITFAPEDLHFVEQTREFPLLHLYSGGFFVMYANIYANRVNAEISSGDNTLGIRRILHKTDLTVPRHIMNIKNDLTKHLKDEE